MKYLSTLNVYQKLFNFEVLGENVLNINKKSRLGNALHVLCSYDNLMDVVIVYEQSTWISSLNMPMNDE